MLNQCTKLPGVNLFKHTKLLLGTIIAVNTLNVLVWRCSNYYQFSLIFFSCRSPTNCKMLLNGHGAPTGFDARYMGISHNDTLLEKMMDLMNGWRVLWIVSHGSSTCHMGHVRCHRVRARCRRQRAHIPANLHGKLFGYVTVCYSLCNENCLFPKWC